MKHVFVLDENILVQSHNCKDIKNPDEENYDSLELVITILTKCHKIGLTSELITKYQEWLKKLEQKRTNIPMIRAWNHFLVNRNKHVVCDNHLNDLPTNLDHDRHVIEPAHFLNGTLVTRDQNLKERWNAWNQSKQYNLDIKSPKDAIAFLSASNQ
ncbi:hypothetical protein MUP37_02130 [Candidatus Bathyarchaeota archaeon]|nr:hypothetical protein [Candidatus Bathyarchaeota archaeon]